MQKWNKNELHQVKLKGNKTPRQTWFWCL